MPEDGHSVSEFYRNANFPGEFATQCPPPPPTFDGGYASDHTHEIFQVKTRTDELETTRQALQEKTQNCEDMKETVENLRYLKNIGTKSLA